MSPGTAWRQPYHGEQGNAAVTDNELLRRYVTDGSEEALAELVRRYLRPVHSTCLRILGDPHDAEDATQAVFIALARKARKIRRGSALSV